MQQTSKYQFNLVESGDAFSPAPLNDNMEKVEAALENAEAAQTMCKLASYYAQTETVNAVLSLSSVDMSQFAYLELWVGGVTATAGSLYLQFNGDSSSKYVASGSSGTSPLTQFTLLSLNTSSSPTAAVLKIMDEARGRIHFSATIQSYQTMNMGTGYSTCYGMYTGCGLAGLSSVRVYGSQALNAGIEFVLYGIKK